MARKPGSSDKKQRKKRKPGRSERHSKSKKHTSRHGLPEICVVDIVEIDEDGEVLAVPAKWDDKIAAPHIRLGSSKGKAGGVGDRVLARLQSSGTHKYHGETIKILPKSGPRPVLGVFTRSGKHGIIEPIQRKERKTYLVAPENQLEAGDGELVSGETLPAPHGQLGMQEARITERLGTLSSAKGASLIAIHSHDLPVHFSPEALSEAEIAEEPVMEKGRADLRDIPLVTIDGEDARDYDDAVFAEPHKDGGWHLVVAIADVARYVHPESVLDQEAFQRGNSVYFPDRVVPMLPERLSNGLCSLVPDEDRYCLAAHLWIDDKGHTKRYRFERGIMRSAERLTYKKVQEVIDSGKKHPQITPLHHAYQCLKKERDKRGALNINLPEYGIHLDKSGNVRSIHPKERYASHQLIELFMIAANVAAADFLLENRGEGIYRVHEPPDPGRLEELRNLLEHLGYQLYRGEGIQPKHFNDIFAKSAERPEETIIQQAVLRSQMQAYYGHNNLGHFGLGLKKYTHFTSPIRRYSDLVVHREIIRILDKEKRTKEKQKSLAATADHISGTERKAMMAERDAMDRYRASYMASKVGETYEGVITGANEAGLFVTLPESGVTGYCPIRSLGHDFFHYDKRAGELRGRRTRMVFGVGMTVLIRVEEANGLTGSLIFSPQSEASAPLTQRGAKPKKHGKHRDKGRRPPKGKKPSRRKK